MAEVTRDVPDAGFVRDRRYALRLLQATCLLAALAGAALLGAAVSAIVVDDPSSIRKLRVAMLHPGMTLLAVALAASAMVASRVARFVDDPSLRRLRERVYFVAAVAALVLAPSALLGWHWAGSAQSLAGVLAVQAMELVAMSIVLALLVRNARDALRLAAQARPARRSISSIL